MRNVRRAKRELASNGLERFPIRLTRKLQGSWPESALDSMFVAFPIGKPVSTFPGNALMPAPAGCGQLAHCWEVLFVLASAPMG